jgi:hypothetical protein
VQFLRLDQVPVSPGQRVYRHSAILALVVWLAGCAADAALLHAAFADHWKVGYLFGGLLLLFLLLFRRFVTATFRASNWLVRATETGIYVQYRSYLNFHLPADAPTVVVLAYAEIASARLIRERLTTPDPAGHNRTQTQILRHVELELRGDTHPLAEALQAEREQKASMLFRDYPVTLTNPPRMRIHWNVFPRAGAFLNLLRPYATIGEPISEKEDLADFRHGSAEEKQDRLRALIQRGQVIDAIQAARRLYGCDLAEAKRMVDRLIEDQKR